MPNNYLNNKKNDGFVSDNGLQSNKLSTDNPYLQSENLVGGDQISGGNSLDLNIIK